MALKDKKLRSEYNRKYRKSMPTDVKLKHDDTSHRYNKKYVEQHTTYIGTINCPYCHRKMAKEQIETINHKTGQRSISVFGQHMRPYHYVKLGEVD